MERKRIVMENSLHQQQEFGIVEYEDHIEIDVLLSDGLERLEIPGEINGKPVTVIAAQAFARRKTITEAILPDSVKEIGHHAFQDCRGLKKVVMPGSLKCLPTGLFAFCELEAPEILLPEGLEEIEGGAFWRAGNFEIRIPESVKKIGVGAFYDGPDPLTALPYDKGWFSMWPYGETVIAGNVQGKISGLHHLDGNCLLHEVTFGTEVKNFFYPCDYLEEKIRFADEENRQRIKEEIGSCWKSGEELSETYKVRQAWERGII